MVDLLTEKVNVRLSPSTELVDQQLKIADVSTSSFEAYKYYRKGRENLWRWNFPYAAKNFKRAVAIDSTFAMAHLFLAVTEASYGLAVVHPLTDLTSIRTSIQIAKKHAAKATDKKQRLIDIYEALFNRQFETADRLAADFVKQYPEEKDGAFLLGITSWFTHKYDQSIKALERTLEIDPTYANAYNQLQIIVNYLAGVTMVKKSDYSKAQTHAAKIEKFIQSENYDDLYMDYYYLILGELDVAQDNGQAAMDALGQVSVLTDLFSPRYKILEAASHALKGALEKAVSIYLNFQNEVGRRAYGMGDYFYYFLERSKVNYHVARLQERQGKIGKAIEHYQKFLHLWKDADPGIAEVAEVKNRLSQLQSGQLNKQFPLHKLIKA